MILLRSLASSNSLKNLSITFAHGRHSRSTFIDLSRLQFWQLESLRWGGGYQQCFQIMELANFVKAHRSTLRRVDLGMICVYPEGIEDKETFGLGIAGILRGLTGLDDIFVQKETEQVWFENWGQDYSYEAEWFEKSWGAAVNHQRSHSTH